MKAGRRAPICASSAGLGFACARALAAEGVAVTINGRDEARLVVAAGRLGTPQELGAACAWLCSAHAGYVSGQNLSLDGGTYPGVF